MSPLMNCSCSCQCLHMVQTYVQTGHWKQGKTHTLKFGRDFMSSRLFIDAT